MLTTEILANDVKITYPNESKANKLIRHIKRVQGTIYCPSFRKEIYSILHKEQLLKDINSRMKGKWF